MIYRLREVKLSVPLTPAGASRTEGLLIVPQGTLS